MRGDREMRNFATIPSVEHQRSMLDLSHRHKFTMDAGYLNPAFVVEALPGDTFTVRVNGLARLNTPVFPLMDDLVLETFFFAVPYRLIWDNWERFNGAQDNPTDSTVYQTPIATGPVAGYANGSLQDMMGIPPGIPQLEHVNLAMRAYNLCFNEWFRSQDLQDSVVVDKGDGPDDWTNYSLLRRGKRHDYFTSALPFPQKGPASEISIGSTAPVSGASTLLPRFNAGGTGPYNLVATSGLGTVNLNTPATASGNLVWQFPALEADLSAATPITINALREAFQIQRLYERDARGGTRYTEIVRSHFGVVSADQRLQRPEYLGGGSSPILITPVAQTTSTDATSPQGNLAAYATSVINGHGFKHSFSEHCIVLGLFNVRAPLTYQQGLHRMWSRRDRFDFFWPALQHLGEQAIFNKEIYAQGPTGGSADDDVFGYIGRYDEYRYMPNRVSGRFRSQDPLSLDAWHLGLDFGSLPVLGATFIQDDPPIDRVVAVPTEPHMIMDAYFDFKAARPMATYSVPGLVDHF